MRELRKKLKHHGFRMTAQRAAIYETLRQSERHPTAEELFFEVRQMLPSVSLATIYNTLEMLVEHGLAVKLMSNGPARYDGACAPHGHARFLSCGSLRDVPQLMVADVLGGIPVPEDFTVKCVTVELTGLCPQCREMTDASPARSY